MREPIKYFENEEVNRLFNIWLNNYPNSFHPCDMKRWTNFVLSSLANDEILELPALAQALKDYNHRDDDKHIENSYWSRYSSMKDLYFLMKEKD